VIPASGQDRGSVETENTTRGSSESRPSKHRSLQVLLILTLIPFCWLAMQVVHEAGHVTVALLTHAEVIKVGLHPLVMSHTDVGENPHPLAVVWGGPALGSALPLLVFLVLAVVRAPGVYMYRFFAGFCLIANGVYIGVGRFIADGADPWMMTENGSPRWVLVMFGLITFPLGLYLWHRQGKHFGLGEAKGKVNPAASFISAGLLAGVVVAELVYNSR